jgi:hypothetical protein
MDSRRSTIDNVCRSQWRQITEPQYGRFRFGASKLIGLNDLSGSAISDDCGSVSVHYGVLDRNWPLPNIEELEKERGGGSHSLPAFLVSDFAAPSGIKPAHAGVAEERAGRVSYHQIERPPAKCSDGVTLDVVWRPILRFNQVTRPSIMPALSERGSDDAGKLASNENLHGCFSWPVSLAGTAIPTALNLAISTHL